MMMEHIEGGTLLQYLQEKGGHISEEEAQKIFIMVT
jgi:hypothetical protein